MQLPLDGNVSPQPFLMQLGYFAPRSVTLAVTFGLNQYQVTLAATPLGYGYLPVEGPGATVGITSLTPDPKICIGNVTVGNVQPSATGIPTPAVPLRG